MSHDQGALDRQGAANARITQLEHQVAEIMARLEKAERHLRQIGGYRPPGTGPG